MTKIITMILIADGGSTKCDWAICNENGGVISKCQTIGFNPKYITLESVMHELSNSELESIKDNVSKIIFFGAGCSNESRNSVLEKILSIFFSKAKIDIKHDLEAAYLATYNGNPIICSILGTGSNSCLFDGKKCIENAPSLGYILGDEGSGNYFGKKLLNLYMNNKLSVKLKLEFEKIYGSNKESIIENIYTSARPNLYLASFFKFILNNKEDEHFNKILTDGIRDFFNLHICCYKNFEKYPLTFVGSVAYFLSDYLYKIADEKKCKISSIIKSPIDNVVANFFKS